MNEVVLPSGDVTFVDDEDMSLINEYPWRACKSPMHDKVYVINDHLGALHRQIMQAPTHLEVDHRDGNGLNNVRSNLRLATQSQNRCNAFQPQGENGSGYRGVIRNGPSWSARIRVNNVMQRLGTYKDKEDAARAYDIAAIEYHGEFAVLNFDRSDYAPT